MDKKELLNQITHERIKAKKMLEMYSELTRQTGINLDKEINAALDRIHYCDKIEKDLRK